jgi:dTDP-glucose pyrophosphorylase/predicted transcriptional regulator
MASELVYTSKKSEIWRNAIIQESSSIGDAIHNLNQVGIKIVLVVAEDNKLIGTIVDGDIRRGLLRGLDLNSSIASILHHNPLVVQPEMLQSMVSQLMVANKVQQIPIVDSQQKIVGLYLWDEINEIPTRSNLMIIMAGGMGTRLMPHTETCPKPMVLVAGKPMLEHIINRGKLEGFNHFVLAIYHLGHLIENYFGDGERLGVRIDYLREQSPLGTAGALSLLNHRPSEPLVVTNGDVITDIRYGEMLDFHHHYQASATMAVRVHEWQHPFGVVQMEGVKIVGFEEKPMARNHINAGVYVLSPETLDELSAENSCTMPMLFERLQTKNKHTIAYPMHEPWLDVGRPEDLETVRSNLVKDLA